MLLCKTEREPCSSEWVEACCFWEGCLCTVFRLHNHTPHHLNGREQRLTLWAKVCWLPQVHLRPWEWGGGGEEEEDDEEEEEEKVRYSIRLPYTYNTVCTNQHKNGTTKPYHSQWWHAFNYHAHVHHQTHPLRDTNHTLKRQRRQQTLLMTCYCL